MGSDRHPHMAEESTIGEICNESRSSLPDGSSGSASGTWSKRLPRTSASRGPSRTRSPTTGERFDVAVGLLYRSIEIGEENLALGRENVAIGRENLAIGRMMLDKQDQMLDKQDQMLDKQDQMLDKQDQMLDKQDTTISILKNIKEDTSEIGVIKEEVSAARYEARREREEIISTLKSGSLEEKYEELSREIAEIKAAIAEIRAKVS